MQTQPLMYGQIRPPTPIQMQAMPQTSVALPPPPGPSTLPTTLRRRAKTIKLSSTGIFSVKQKVPAEALERARFVKGEEFETIRYTAVTCDPDDFIARGYDIRAARYRRPIEICIVVTMYNEDHIAFLRTMYALAQNIKYICSKDKYGWDSDGWKKIVVCIIADGRAKIHPNVLCALEALGVYQDGIAQASVNGIDTEAHVFEYTTQLALDEKLHMSSSKDGICPMQIVFCLKEKNAKKINSHRWFFNAFCEMVNPRVCVLIDVGTKPEMHSVYRLWKAFYRNPQIAGACGEIRADLGEGFDYLKNLFNPLVASQNFEYKISNLLDKSLESVFGYITVLPGAFSAYRFEAIQNNSPGVGPLAKYFEGESREGVVRDSSIFSANLYLAEDRILCFELVAKRDAKWTLHYVAKAYAETDVPESVPEFLSQRRRWLNGSLFAGIYAMSNISRIWATRHSFLRRIVFTIQYIYNVINQIFSWFILGNFAVTFYYLLQQLKITLNDPSSSFQSTGIASKIIKVIINIASTSYPVVLICLFIVAFGNRPQAYRRFYTVLMFLFGIIGAGMMGVVINRIVALARLNLFEASPNPEVISNLNGYINQLNTTSSDTSVLIVRSIIMQTSRVMKKRIAEQFSSMREQALTFTIAFASTIGAYFIASAVQMDIAHMFTSFIQYLLLLPSYINVLTVYALANLHDVSWGTKGDTKAESLPALRIEAQKDGTMVANVAIVADRRDISAHYRESIRTLAHASNASQSEPKPTVDAKTKQEDDYKGFRTALILSYIASNGILYFIATQLDPTFYITILLNVIAALSGIKLIGVVMFVIARAWTEMIKRRDARGQWIRSHRDQEHPVNPTVTSGKTNGLVDWKNATPSRTFVDDEPDLSRPDHLTETASVVTADV